MSRTIVVLTGRRPFTVNHLRRMHYRVRAAEDLWWRTTALKVVREMGAEPHVGPVVLTVTPLMRNRAGVADVGAIYPAAKAAEDGLVDAHLIAGDGPKHVVRKIFEPPRVTGEEGLEIIVEDAA